MSQKQNKAADAEALAHATEAGNLGTLAFTQLGSDLIHRVFHDAPLAKRSLSMQLFRAGINAAAWKARNDQGEAFFAGRRDSLDVAPVVGGWIEQANEQSENMSAPKYDRDLRDGAGVALGLIALALDYEFVPPSATYIPESIMKACKRLGGGLTNTADASALASLQAATEDAATKAVIAETFVSYKTDWLNVPELEKAVIGIIDCPLSQMKEISPGDILAPRDVIRPMIWALGDPHATTNKFGAFFDAVKAKEAGQVKVILEAIEELREIEAQLFPVNEEA